MIETDGQPEQLSVNTPMDQCACDPDEITFSEFTDILLELREQPHWRVQADKEMDYKDGNQLDSKFLATMRELGIPPAVAPMIGLSIESALGAEAKRRTDWRVIPDGDNEGQDIADAFDWKLNAAERRSRADRACSDAYESQYSVGVGWVEVTRDENPFNYPYRCINIHRNEMFWDWPGYLKAPMGQDARWLVRKNWIDKDIVKLRFPDKADLLDASSTGWHGFDTTLMDGGHSTDLYAARDQERGWTIEEQDWRNVARRRVMLFEVWYRRWTRAMVLKSPNGRVVEFEMDNPNHQMAVIAGAELSFATLNKVRRAWFAGPHKLADDPTPYLHNYFGYVPFWGHREDRTGVPFGRIRSMMYMQDNINASLSKIRWGLSSTRTIRTDGAYKGSADKLRNEIARPNADIVLDANHMAQPGAKFEVARDFELSEQQYKMYIDSKDTLNHLGGTPAEYMGQASSASGTAQAGQVEQSNQGMANIDDNFKESRSHVGELLLSMIVQDSIGKHEVVNIDGGAIQDDRSITLNAPATDENGMQYLNNDVSKIMLKVDLDDVPSTSSYKNQQFVSFSEAFKATSPDAQRIMMPYLIELMDVPYKDEIIKALKEQDAQPSPAQIEQDQKTKELELKSTINDAQIKLLTMQAVKTGTEAQYAGFQAGLAMAQTPDAQVVARIADVVVQNAGMPQVHPAGFDPQYEDAAPAQPLIPPQPQQQNTSPQLPPVPPIPATGMTGIETQRGSDNQPGVE